MMADNKEYACRMRAGSAVFARAARMIYVVTSLWLVCIVLMAWGVHHLWSTIFKPRIVDIALLPGTLIAQTGRIVGLLITGAKINGAALVEEDDDPSQATEPRYAPKIPVFGPVVVGWFPMLAIGAAASVVLHRLGTPVLTSAREIQISANLPESMPAFWDHARGLITLAEGTLNALRQADMPAWRLTLFIYLMICLTVRLAPFPGNARGHLGAIAAVGGLLALASTIGPQSAILIEQAWPLLSFVVGSLFLLLLLSLIARGVASTIQTIVNWE